MKLYVFSLYTVFFAMMISGVEAGGLRLKRRNQHIENGFGTAHRILGPLDGFLIEETDRDRERQIFEEVEFGVHLSLSMSYVHPLSMSMVDAPPKTSPPSIKSRPRLPLRLRQRLPSLELRNREPLRPRKRQFYNPPLVGGRKRTVM